MQSRQKKLANTLAKQDKTSNNPNNRMKRKAMFDETGNILLNGVKLSFQRGFGFNQTPEILSPAHCIDDNKAVYLLGKQVVQYDMLTESQKVIDLVEQDEEITAFVYFKNLMLDDNILYGVHAMNKTYPSIVGKNYSKNLSQKYVLAHLEKEQKVVQVLLICENKYIVALSQLQNTFRLSYIDVQSKQVIASESIYFKVQGMLVPEAAPKYILLYTLTEIYLLQFGPEIKPVPLGMSKYLTNQTIVQTVSSLFTNNDPMIYLITSNGNLVFASFSISPAKIVSVQNVFLGQFQTIDENENVITKNRMPSSICCNEYNILIGYHFIEEFTLVKICPVITSKPALQKISFSCPNLHKIVRMQFAHETMSVCVIVQVKQNDRYDLSIPIQSDYLKQKGEQSCLKSSPKNHRQPAGKIFPVVFNMLLHDTLVETLRSPIQSVLGWMLFVKEILDVATLPTKKIMLILSKQRKIKAVKYDHLSSTSFQRMLIWEMYFNHNDCPTSLDIHPLTYNVAIGFKEGLKLFTISSQGLKPSNIQFPLKNCESVRYSKFGHKLIAGSSNQIILINPYENKIIQTISLSSSYNVKELAFIDRDMYVFCQFGNGSAQVMNCEGGKVFEVWKKQSKTICAAYDSVFDVMVVSYSENFTKFYRERGSQQFGVLWTYPFNVTKILIVNELGTIFMGTSMGKIRAYQWPFTDMMRFSKSFTEIQLHSSAITRLRIINDLSLLISGAEDGSIFISKINAYSDGIAITDAEIMHSLRSSNKNYTNLFYLQNYMITSSAIEFGHEETIVQLQSDKADFESEYSETIARIQQENEQRLRRQEKEKETQFKQELLGREQQIQQLNEKKILLREQINEVLKKRAQTQQQLELEKETKMRELNKQRDQLEAEREQVLNECAQSVAKQKLLCEHSLREQQSKWQQKEQQLQKQIQQLEKEHDEAIVRYGELLKEESEEGVEYKTRMLAVLEEQLEGEKEQGQKLRKNYNKIKHETGQEEEKIKQVQQLVTEMQIDTATNMERLSEVRQHQAYLGQVLQEKDRVILEEERDVKVLLAKNINNYTQEEYLKHRQEELLDKVKFLENEIIELDEKYNNFQNDFVAVTRETNQLKLSIEQAQQLLKNNKNQSHQLKNQLSIKNYNLNHLLNATLNAFDEAKCQIPQFRQQLHKILTENSDQINNKLASNTSSTNKSTNKSMLNQTETTNSQEWGSAQSSEAKINKRDHLIKQVVNTNKLRKIDDNIRRTIMIKLNRETVSLTCEVNELRKQKKKLHSKLNQLKHYLNELNELNHSNSNKENHKVKQKNSSQNTNFTYDDEDIVPANISIIRSKPSKHITSVSSRDKLLPFQVYHSNKLSKHSYHSRYPTKPDLDESSTQLPSMLPSLLKNHSLSQESSRLFNVAELIEQDEVNYIN